MQTSWLASQNTSFLPLSIQLASSKVITRLYFQDITGLFYKLVHKAKLSAYMWDITSRSIVFLCIHVFWSGHQLTWLATATWWWVAFLPSWFYFKFFATASCFLFFLLRHPQWSAPLHPKHTSRSQMNGRCAVFCSNSWLWLNEACCNGKAPEVITLRKNTFYFFWIQCFRFKRLLSLKHFCAFVHFQLK